MTDYFADDEPFPTWVDYRNLNPDFYLEDDEPMSRYDTWAQWETDPLYAEIPVGTDKAEPVIFNTMQREKLQRKIDSLKKDIADYKARANHLRMTIRWNEYVLSPWWVRAWLVLTGQRPANPASLNA